MMGRQWFVIGISGTTCSGKTTLAERLLSLFPGSVFISQDDYFLPVDSPLHTWVKELGHINWEIMSALDMHRMCSDVKNILSQNPTDAVLPEKAKRVLADSSANSDTSINGSFPNVLILEGFLLFNNPDIFHLCNLHYFLTLSREQCWDRRHNRVYEPPDVPGYFDKVVWPEYVKHRDALVAFDRIKFIDGSKPVTSILENVLIDIRRELNSE